MVLCAYFPASVWREARRAGRESKGRSALVGLVGAVFSYWLLSTVFKWATLFFELYQRYLATSPVQYFGMQGIRISVFANSGYDGYLVSASVLIGGLMFFIVPLVILAFPSIAHRPDLGKVWRIWAYSLVTLPLALMTYPVFRFLEVVEFFQYHWPRVWVQPSNVGRVQAIITIGVAALWLIV
jgi:hypothetical protein